MWDFNSSFESNIMQHVREKLTTYFSRQYKVTTTKNDKYIIETVKDGFSLNLDNVEPSRKPFEYPKNCLVSKILNTEIQKFRQKEVVYFSNLFPRKKKDGTYQAYQILNLKSLNKECFTEHFKMKFIKDVILMIKQDMLLTSHLDIKNTSFSVPVCKIH